MRKITLVLGLLLSAFSLNSNAAAGDVVTLPVGKYTIKNSVKGTYCASDGALIYKVNAVTDSKGVFTITYVSEKSVYTIQDCDDKYLVTSTGEDVTVTDQTTDLGDKIYWRIVEDYGTYNGVDIISLVKDNAAKSKAWNFSQNYNNQGANTGLGTWDADDGSSCWTLDLQVDLSDIKLDKTGWSITVSSACDDNAPSGQASCIIDGSDGTYWHSNWGGGNAYGTGNTLPQWFVIDLGEELEFKSFRYVRRKDKDNGKCKAYKLYVQSTPFDEDFTRAAGCDAAVQAKVTALTGEVAGGELTYDDDYEAVVDLPSAVTGRYVMFVYTDSQGDKDGDWACCGEFDLFNVTKSEIANKLSQKNELQLTIKKANLSSLMGFYGGKYPFNIIDGATLMWPGEFNYSGNKATLFTDAQTAIDENDATQIAATTAGLRSFKALGNVSSFDYEFKKEYATVTFPCNSGKPEGVTIYSCAGVGENGALTLESATSFVSNTPYIVQGTVGSKYQHIVYANQKNAEAASMKTGILQGTHEDVTAPEGSYVLQEQDGVLAFYRVGTEVQPTVKAGRCYIVPENGGEVRAFYINDAATAITGIRGENKQAAIYDLSGRRVKAATKGIFIINGKKVIK